MESREFGNYTLLEQVGKGGMGRVFRASDNRTGRIVALKTFESDEDRSPEMSRKLRDREVRMLISVQHPNVVKYFESGHVEDDFYYVMEFVEDSLLFWLRSGKELSLVDKVHLLRQTASALAAVHHQGIVHRDVKPGNILLDQDPNGAIHVKLTDLGIAKNVREADIVREQTHRRVPGTPRYLSPEQIKMRPLDGRSDVFGLGIVAYELFSGEKPFHAEESRGYLKANVRQEPRPLAEFDGALPGFLGDIVSRMLAKDREERYDSEALARDLELAHQHLVSGAPMVETTNPASLFYEPPAPEEEQQPATLEAIAPAAWGVAAGIVVMAVVAVALLWPRPAAGTPLPSEAPQLLEHAEEAAEAGRRWQAVALLNRATGQELGPDQQHRRDELLSAVQQSLAVPAEKRTRRMLEEGRFEEAQAMVEFVERRFPLSPITERMKATLEEQRPEPPAEGGAKRMLRPITELVAQGRYAEALHRTTEMLQVREPEADQAARLRASRREIAEKWANHLLRNTPRSKELETFFAEVDDSDLPDGGLLDRLRLHLAETYRVEGSYREALRWYAAVARRGGPEIERRARAEAEELRDRLSTEPMHPDRLAGELGEKGFQSAVWDSAGEMPQNTEAMRLSCRQGETVRWRTVQPVRNRGFVLEVEMKAGAKLVGDPGRARAGIAVRDGRGTAAEISFDGEGGRLLLRRPGTDEAEVRELRPAGSEGWQRLSLHYSFEEGRLTASLDGEETEIPNLELSDFVPSLFLEVGEDAPPPDARQPWTVQFRDISFTR